MHATPVHAEKADRSKPVDVEADIVEKDDLKKTTGAKGNVVLTQGTLQVKAERITVKEDDDGYIFAQAFGTADKQIAFRQKREGLNEYFEGFADRVEYDNRANTVKLFSKARLKSGNDDAKGEYIYYNSVDETYKLANVAPAENGATAAKPANGERARLTFQPKVKDASAEPAKK
jgi:lipopolysaccharide export system protein LptA